MKVIALVQQKGGVGKTTLAVNLAGELARREFSVVLIDADPQGSAWAWSTPRNLGVEVRHELLTPAKPSTWIKNVLKLSAQFVIVDTPADLGKVFRTAVDISDLVIVPCGPSSLDINSARQTLKVIGELSSGPKAAGPKVMLVPTRVDPSTPEGQQIGEELAELGEVVAPAISYDVAFVRAFSSGRSVSTSAPGARADVEMRRIADIVLAQLAPQQRLFAHR